MIRLHIIAEGQTEKNFVSRVLAPHLARHGVYADSRCVLVSRDKKAGRTHRGGMTSYQRAKADILAWIKEDRAGDCRFSTMFDLYALPGDFPGFVEAKELREPYVRVQSLENALAREINDRRFIPYIQLHEFEALILADPSKLQDEYFERESAIEELKSLSQKINPELIDDGPETAPSKRILKEIPEYDKATAGPAIAASIGISTLRRRCEHFGEWLSALESLSK